MSSRDGKYHLELSKEDFQDCKVRRLVVDVVVVSLVVEVLVVMGLVMEVVVM